MRRIQREDLPSETVSALQAFQQEVSESPSAGDHWSRKRRSEHVLEALSVLKRMAGARVRCMYCVDSEGSDIEHFWPKSSYPDRMYVWENLLLACAHCGRFKGAQFPLNSTGLPLLVDPSAEDPWNFIDFDPDTGNLNARYLLPLDQYSEKGEITVRLLHLDKREGVSAGYRRTYERLCQLVTDWTDHHLAADYVDQLYKADDHGLLGWFLHGSGQAESCFSRFRERYQEAWIACRESLL